MVIIKNGIIVDLNSGKTEKRDIYINEGKITEADDKLSLEYIERVIDAEGMYIAPGLVDMHVHFRDPGFEYKEDILTGALSAAAGGITTACCMPNTRPATDNAEIVTYIKEKAKNAAIRVLPVAAVTLGQNGQLLTDFRELKAAGACAFSDDGMPVMNSSIMLNALYFADMLDLLVISHCEDASLAEGRAINEGAVSQKLGISGRPSVAEDIMVSRDVMLSEYSGTRVHIAHVSTAKSVDIIRAAKKRGVRVSCETCPQYFSFTENEVLAQGTLAKMFPPLRTEKDRLAIIEGLRDGTIDVIATDHAPHSEAEKDLGLIDAPGGMTGLETSLSVCLTVLYHRDKLGLIDLLRKMSQTPARLLGLQTGGFETGDTADFVLFDPAEVWTVDPSKFKSKSTNTPFAGKKLKGAVKYTICGGKIVFASDTH